MFYASPALRDRLRMSWPEDAGLLEDLVEQVIDLVATWKPTTEWHMLSVVRTGRTLEWMVWQVATAADDELGPMYREDPVMPFAIDLATLAALPAAADAARAPRRPRLTSRPLTAVTDRAKAATNAARLAAELPGPAADRVGGSHAAVVDEPRPVGRHRPRRARRSSGSRSTGPATAKVAASSILNAYYTDTDVVLAVWAWLERHGVTDRGRVRAGLRPRRLDRRRAGRGAVRRRRHRPDLGAGRRGVDRRQRGRVTHRGVAPRPQRTGR